MKSIDRFGVASCGGFVQLTLETNECSGQSFFNTRHPKVSFCNICAKNNILLPKSLQTIIWPVWPFFNQSLHLHYVSPTDGMASIINLNYMETLNNVNLLCLAPFSTYHLMPREKPSQQLLASFRRRWESNPGHLRSKLVRYPLLRHP